MFRHKPTRYEVQLQRQVAELESENESLRRQLKISEAEIEGLSLLVARNIERTKSELATAARQTAGGQ